MLRMDSVCDETVTTKSKSDDCPEYNEKLQWWSDNRILIFPAAEDAVRGDDHGNEGYEEEPSRSHCDGPAKDDLKGQGFLVMGIHWSTKM